MRRELALIAMILIAFAGCSDDSSTPTEPDTGPAVGTITTWAGTGVGGWGTGDGQPLKKTRLYQPIDVEFTPTLGTFVIDWQNHRIRKVMDDGTLQTIMGLDFIGDGPLPPNEGSDLGAWWPGLDCALNHPTDLQELSNGYLMLTAWHNHKLREWDPATGMERVFIGGPAGCTDNADLATAQLNQSSHAIEDPANPGVIYVLDQRNQVIRKVDRNANMVTTVVGGDPVCSPAIEGSYAGDGGPPSQARLSFPTGPNPFPGGGLTMDSQGRLIISDTNNHRIRRVDFTADLIETIAGNGVAGFSGDGGDPKAAMICSPLDVEIGPDGNIYFADSGNNRVRMINLKTNTIRTIAGNGQFSDTGETPGDGGPATQAVLGEPRGVSFDPAGNLYIADTYNNRIRKVWLYLNR